jgi:hypothetical protein
MSIGLIGHLRLYTVKVWQNILSYVCNGIGSTSDTKLRKKSSVLMLMLPILWILDRKDSRYNQLGTQRCKRLHVGTDSNPSRFADEEEDQDWR